MTYTKLNIRRKPFQVTSYMRQLEKEVGYYWELGWMPMRASRRKHAIKLNRYLQRTYGPPAIRNKEISNGK